MRSGVLEKIRILEEDLETCRESVVQQMLLKIANPRHEILRDHFIVQQAAVAKSISNKLLDSYLDEDDIVHARNDPTEEGDVLEAIRDFDAKVAELREYHKRYVNTRPIERTVASPDPALLDNVFSLQEYYGAYLDLLPHYESYQKFLIESRLNATETSAFAQPLEFHKFTEQLPTMMLTGIPCQQKLAAITHYETFIDGLLSYFGQFFVRIKPLDQSPFANDLSAAERGYREFRDVMEKHKLTQQQHLKRFEKHYAVWDYVKATVAGCSAEAVDRYSIIEAQIVRVLTTSLATVFQATERRAQRIGSKTSEEIERERKEDDRQFLESLNHAGKYISSAFVDHVAKAELTAAEPQAAAIISPQADEAEDDEPEFIGADGKPLPKWLVKIMQLKKKFRCDVCGGEVFKGLKMYREHFTLERHSEGLRQLGVGYAHMNLFVGLNEMGDVLRFRDLLLQHFDRMNLRKRIRDDADNEENQDINGNVMTVKNFSVFQGKKNSL